jgi:hypothetical protein
MLYSSITLFIKSDLKIDSFPYDPKPELPFVLYLFSQYILESNVIILYYFLFIIFAGIPTNVKLLPS